MKKSNLEPKRMRLTQKQQKIKFRAQVKCYIMTPTFIPTLARKPDNYISGGKQPVRVPISEFTQPRLKRPEGGRKPEAVNRKCKTGFESSKDKQTTKPVPAVEYKYAWSSGYSVNRGGG